MPAEFEILFVHSLPFRVKGIFLHYTYLRKGIVVNFNGPLIVNLGSGYKQPLREGELESFPELKGWRILNFDFRDFPPVPEVYQMDSVKGLKLGDVWNANVEKKIPLGDCSVDVVVSVSPYGYSVLSKEVYRILKPRGLIIIWGNGSNKFIQEDHEKNDEMIIGRLRSDAVKELDQLSGYNGVSRQGDFFARYEYTVEHDLVERCKKYLLDRGSYVTGGYRETKLDTCLVFRKCKNIKFEEETSG
ncbi:hypothetical protein [Microbulbifer sp. JMSA008]|uniref:hypothetical protein n=1 Tax=Microbulbifer sp. JMSA008 TaxID=3243373 RepID=UPI0040395185